MMGEPREPPGGGLSHFFEQPYLPTNLIMALLTFFLHRAQKTKANDSSSVQIIYACPFLLCSETSPFWAFIHLDSFAAGQFFTCHFLAYSVSLMKLALELHMFI